MKAVLSVLLTSLAGKAGDVVAASWKGIQYFRARVIPANPQSVDQTTQRGYFTRVVSYYHDLEAQVTDYLKTLVTGLQMSGFNAFVKRNVQDFADSVDARMMPLNAVPNPVGGLTASTGTATKQIDLAWPVGEADPTHKIYVLSSEISAGEPSDNLKLEEKDTTLTNASPITLTMGKATQEYGIWLLAEDTATHEFSIAVYDEATSQT